MIEYIVRFFDDVVSFSRMCDAIAYMRFIKKEITDDVIIEKHIIC